MPAEHSGISMILILLLAASVASSTLASQYTSEMLAKEFRLAVCMVGQVARTEIDSKIQNLVKPNIANSTAHMFLILQQGEARFTNKHGGEECVAAPESLEDAKKEFEQHVPTTAMEYVYKMYDLDQKKWPGYPDTQAAKKARLTNHINQWNSWRKCVKLVEADEVRTGKFYNAVLRIRDNAIVLEPFNVLERLKILAQQVSRKEEMPKDSYKTYRNYLSHQTDLNYLEQLPVLTKACSAWKGVNDKVPPPPPPVSAVVIPIVKRAAQHREPDGLDSLAPAAYAGASEAHARCPWRHGRRVLPDQREQDQDQEDWQPREVCQVGP